MGIRPPEPAIVARAEHRQPEEPKIRQVDIDRRLRVHRQIARAGLGRVRRLDQFRPAFERDPRMRQRLALADRADQQRAARVGGERGTVGGKPRDDDQWRAVRERLQGPPGWRADRRCPAPAPPVPHALRRAPAPWPRRSRWHRGRAARSWELCHPPIPHASGVSWQWTIAGMLASNPAPFLPPVKPCPNCCSNCFPKKSPRASSAAPPRI